MKINMTEANVVPGQTGARSVHEAPELIPAGSSALAEPQGNTGSPVVSTRLLGGLIEMFRAEYHRQTLYTNVLQHSKCLAND